MALHPQRTSFVYFIAAQQLRSRCRITREKPSIKTRPSQRRGLARRVVSDYIPCILPSNGGTSMKRIFLLSILFLAVVAGNTLAAGCPTIGVTRLTSAQIVTAFNGNTATGKLVCAERPGTVAGAAGNINRWAEEHPSSGRLFEFAKGPGHPIDPRKDVGTWETTNDDRIKYTYGDPGGPYTWSVWFQPPGLGTSDTYHFCDGATLIATGSLRTLPPASNNPCGYP
jgi:hypothetical protein